MVQTKAVEFTSTKNISKIDTDRSNTTQGEYVGKTLRSNGGERILENSTNCQDSYDHGVRGLQSRGLTNISICDGFGCNREAIIKIVVNAGELGTIDLNLCGDCRLKFKKSIIKEKQQAAPPFWKDQDQWSSRYLVGKEVEEY
jgi:hypothetical protein